MTPVPFHEPVSSPLSSLPPAHTPNTTVTNKWGPYNNSGDFASSMAVIIAALLAALALGLTINAAVRYLLCPLRNRRRIQNPDPEKPPAITAPPPPLPPETVYAAAGADGAAAECVICLTEFVSGDRVRVLPVCGHAFHARCIERWIQGGGSCPTCRAACHLAPAEDKGGAGSAQARV